MMLRTTNRLGTALLLVWVSALRVSAQETSMSGIVRDATEGVLPGVTITAVHVASGNTFTSVTDGAGLYRIPAMRVGIYRVTAELSGFSTVTRENV
ncbi:MAG: carboxypeptidase regulatory-like domain-containing protein [Acidimicrobiia bacterium]|nr:carboxypeptidase regulatory-like domain-containing protein [Acidimicrobiia bacterium]